MSVHIIVDSSCDLTPSIRNKLTVVHMSVFFGNHEYVDGVTIDHKTFYEKLIESDELPHTSQIPPHTFTELFRVITEVGDTAVVLPISSSLSGTYQNAVLAAQDFPGQIFVVDTENAAIGHGILAELGLRLAEKGCSASEIAAYLAVERKNVRLIAMVDTLEYLKRGGRISKTAAFAGSLLSIKPVINVSAGVINVLGKARGSKQGNNLLVSEIGKAGGVDFSKPVLLGYTGLSDVLLQKYIEDSRALWVNGTDALPVAPIGSVIGTHVGPGAIAVAFFCNTSEN